MFSAALEPVGELETFRCGGIPSPQASPRPTLRIGSPHPVSRQVRRPRASRQASSRAGFAVRPAGLAEYVAVSSWTRRLLRWRRRTIRATASVCSARLRLSRTGSTASHTSSGVRPPSTSDAASARGGRFGPRARNSAPSSLVPLAPVQQPQLPHLHLRVAFGLALVRARHLDLDHQIGPDLLDERIGGVHPFRDGRPEPLRTLPEVERTVGLQTGVGRVAAPTEAGRSGPRDRLVKRVRRDAHDRRAGYRPGCRAGTTAASR